MTASRITPCCSLAARLDTYFVESHADVETGVACVLPIKANATHVVHVHPQRMTTRQLLVKGQLTTRGPVSVIKFGGPTASPTADEWEESRAVAGYPAEFKSALIEAQSRGTEYIRLSLFEQTLYGNRWMQVDNGSLLLPIKVS
jgi:hypothetical protein